jgi:2-C-methyl-D-erythritol 4-phosphate cytidylyltransferase
VTVAAVVTAAGYGTRLGAAEPKALVPVAGQPLVAWAISGIAPVVTQLVVTAPPTHLADIQAAADAVVPDFPHLAVRVVAGGHTRQESVALALDALFDGGWPAPDVVLVHDAARAFMPTAVMREAVHAVQGGAAAGAADGAVPVLAIVDTLVSAPGPDGQLGNPVSRDSVRAVQTPQVFSAGALRDAHLRARADGEAEATDDATLLRRYGYRVVAVAGHAAGLKVTHEADLVWANHLAHASEGGGDA